MHVSRLTCSTKILPLEECADLETCALTLLQERAAVLGSRLCPQRTVLASAALTVGIHAGVPPGQVRGWSRTEVTWKLLPFGDTPPAAGRSRGSLAGFPRALVGSSLCSHFTTGPSQALPCDTTETCCFPCACPSSFPRTPGAFSRPAGAAGPFGGSWKKQDE